MWSVACAWGFIFLRDIVLSEIHPEEEEVLRDRVICAMAGLFRLNVNLRLVSLHDRVVISIPEFLAVSLEVLLRLLDTNHPAFGHWAHFYFTFCDVIKIRETWNARDYQRVCERLATQSQAGGRKYDISGLCIRRFNEEVYRDEKDFDTQGFHTVMMCWMVFGQSSETVMRRLLARGAISLLVKAIRRFSRLALKRKQEKWDDTLWYFQFANSIVDCEDFLLVAVGKGQMWITEALDARMLRALASIPATLEGRYSNIPIGRQTEGILDLLKPFVLYRSVFNRVLGDWKRMQREGMTSAIEVVDKAMRGVVKYAEEIKDVHRAFETMTPSLSVHCLNHNCAKCYDNPLDPVRLKRCHRCRVTVYCSRECQRIHWREAHREECERFNRPKRDGISYHTSDLDMAFIRYVVRRGIPKWKEKLLNHHKKGLPGY
ncbi:hypothetical protein PM082_007115 [Marasmius tenuissimus]|nr:hypothetical protein PM082_007115 [Marasmius tenuissimus]